MPQTVSIKPNYKEQINGNNLLLSRSERCTDACITNTLHTSSNSRLEYTYLCYGSRSRVSVLMNRAFRVLIKEIGNCQICADHFEHEPNPIFQLSPKASVLVAGQAPGRKAHKSGIPFNDPSGDRLRDWMGVSLEMFYDADKIAILPMGFCFPGHGRTGDLPPRRECAPAWRQQVLDMMPNIQLTLVIGSYAIDWHLGPQKKHNLTDVVRAWKSHAPAIIPLPHPSPRNNVWLRKNAWFEKDVLPALRARVSDCLS